MSSHQRLQGSTGPGVAEMSLGTMSQPRLQQYSELEPHTQNMRPSSSLGMIRGDQCSNRRPYQGDVDGGRGTDRAYQDGSGSRHTGMTYQGHNMGRNSNEVYHKGGVCRDTGRAYQDAGMGRATSSAVGMRRDIGETYQDVGMAKDTVRAYQDASIERNNREAIGMCRNIVEPYQDAGVGRAINGPRREQSQFNERRGSFQHENYVIGSPTNKTNHNLNHIQNCTPSECDRSLTGSFCRNDQIRNRESTEYRGNGIGYQYRDEYRVCEFRNRHMPGDVVDRNMMDHGRHRGVDQIRDGMDPSRDAMELSRKRMEWSREEIERSRNGMDQSRDGMEQSNGRFEQHCVMSSVINQCQRSTDQRFGSRPYRRDLYSPRMQGGSYCDLGLNNTEDEMREESCMQRNPLLDRSGNSVQSRMHQDGRHREEQERIGCDTVQSNGGLGGISMLAGGPPIVQGGTGHSVMEDGEQNRLGDTEDVFESASMVAEGTKVYSLHSWIIKPVPGTRLICVDGKTSPSDETFWQSGVITRRVTEKAVESSSKSIYKLVGNMNLLDAMYAGFSRETTEAFWLGFPPDWQRLVEEHFRRCPVDGSAQMEEADENDNISIIAMDEGEHDGVAIETISGDDAIETTSGNVAHPIGNVATKVADELRSDESDGQQHRRGHNTQTYDNPEDRHIGMRKPANAVRDQHARNKMENIRDQRARKAFDDGTETKVICDWIIIPLPDNAGVQVQGMRNGKLWTSTAIEERISNKVLLSSTGATYKLKGNMDSLLALNADLPEVIVTRFRHGFPKDWQEQLQEHLFMATVSSRAKTTGIGRQQREKKINKSNKKKKEAMRMDQLDRKKSTPLGRKKIEKMEKDNESIDSPESTLVFTPSGDRVDLSALTHSRSGRLIRPPLLWWAGQHIVESEDGIYSVLGRSKAATQYLDDFNQNCEKVTKKHSRVWKFARKDDGLTTATPVNVIRDGEITKQHRWSDKTVSQSKHSNKIVSQSIQSDKIVTQSKLSDKPATQLEHSNKTMFQSNQFKNTIVHSVLVHSSQSGEFDMEQVSSETNDSASGETDMEHEESRMKQTVRRKTFSSKDVALNSNADRRSKRESSNNEINSVSVKAQMQKENFKVKGTAHQKTVTPNSNNRGSRSAQQKAVAPNSNRKSRSGQQKAVAPNRNNGGSRSAQQKAVTPNSNNGGSRSAQQKTVAPNSNNGIRSRKYGIGSAIDDNILVELETEEEKVSQSRVKRTALQKQSNNKGRRSQREDISNAIDDDHSGESEIKGENFRGKEMAQQKQSSNKALLNKGRRSHRKGISNAVDDNYSVESEMEEEVSRDTARQKQFSTKTLSSSKGRGYLRKDISNAIDDNYSNAIDDNYSNAIDDNYSVESEMEEENSRVINTSWQKRSSMKAFINNKGRGSHRKDISNAIDNNCYVESEMEEKDSRGKETALQKQSHKAMANESSKSRMPTRKSSSSTVENSVSVESDIQDARSKDKDMTLGNQSNKSGTRKSSENRRFTRRSNGAANNAGMYQETETNSCQLRGKEMAQQKQMSKATVNINDSRPKRKSISNNAIDGSVSGESEMEEDTESRVQLTARQKQSNTKAVALKSNKDRRSDKSEIDEDTQAKVKQTGRQKQSSTEAMALNSNKDKRSKKIDYHMSVTTRADRMEDGASDLEAEVLAVLQKTKNKKNAAKLSRLSGGVGTLKRRRALREMLEQHNQNYEDDLFDSTPFRSKKRVELDLGGTNDDSLYAELARKQGKAGFQTPVGDGTTQCKTAFSFASGKKTPAFSQAAIDFHGCADEAYVHKVGQRMKANKRKLQQTSCQEPAKKFKQQTTPNSVNTRLFNEYLKGVKASAVSQTDEDSDVDKYWDN